MKFKTLSLTRELNSTLVPCQCTSSLCCKLRYIMAIQGVRALAENGQLLMLSSLWDSRECSLVPWKVNMNQADTSSRYSHTIIHSLKDRLINEQKIKAEKASLQPWREKLQQDKIQLFDRGKWRDTALLKEMLKANEKILLLSFVKT